MKIILFYLLVLNICQSDDTPEIIKNFQNNNHLILVFSTDNKSSDYEQTLLELARDPLGLDTRDLMIFEIFQRGGIHPNGSPLNEEEVKNLRKFYAVHPDKFTLVIVNKNMTEVFRSDVPVPAQKIFEVIDQT